MADLSTKYLGLDLKNPIVAGSSGLSETVEGVIDLEKNGAGAVVLKSLFEEDILMELHDDFAEMTRPGTTYPDIYDQFDYDTVEDSVSKYLNMIELSKKKVNIPIIASINCVSSREWPKFAKQIEAAGADALELNVFVMPSDVDRTSQENEKIYFDVIEAVKREVKIPISLKISYYFSNLAYMVKELSRSGIEGITMFNRFYSPDFNLENFTVMSTNVLSTPTEAALPLRWISIMSDRVKCDLAASTGIHDGRSAVKMILAGADACHVVSALYRFGNQRIGMILEEMENWMDEKGYDNLDQFRGKLSQTKSKNPAAYERAQFMKYFSGKV